MLLTLCGLEKMQNTLKLLHKICVFLNILKIRNHSINIIIMMMMMMIAELY